MKYSKLPGETNDAAYNRIAGEQGLFCIAFFGHKGTKEQKAKLAYIWKRLLTLPA